MHGSLPFPQDKGTLINIKVTVFFVPFIVQNGHLQLKLERLKKQLGLRVLEKVSCHRKMGIRGDSKIHPENGSSSEEHDLYPSFVLASCMRITCSVSQVPAAKEVIQRAS